MKLAALMAAALCGHARRDRASGAFGKTVRRRGRLRRQPRQPARPWGLAVQLEAAGTHGFSVFLGDQANAADYAALSVLTK
jgi:hypothetical protein